MFRTFACAAALAFFAGAAHADLAISANDGKQVRDDKGPTKDTVSVIAFGSGKPMVIGTVEAPASMIGPPTALAVAPDYSFALVACGQKLGAGNKLSLDDVVSVIGLDDPTHPKLLQTVHSGAGAMGVSMNRKMTMAMVAASGEDAIYVYSIAGRQLTQVGKVQLEAKSEPRDVIIAPDGKSAYVVRWDDGKLTRLAISGTKVAVAGDIVTGVNTDGGAISNDGRYLFNTAFGGTPMSTAKVGAISTTDLKSFKQVAAAEVGNGTENLTLSGDGKYIAVTILNGSAGVRSAPNFATVTGKLKLYHVDGPKLSFVAEADSGHNCQGTTFSDDNKTVLMQCATEKEIEVFHFDGKALTRDMGATLTFDNRPGAIATNKTR
jgi:hypothetical protein